MLGAKQHRTRNTQRIRMGEGQRDLVLRVLAQAQATQKILGERLANALLSGNRNELDRVLRQIAEIVPPAESLASFLELMSELLNRVGQQAVRLNAIGERLRDLSLTDELTSLHNRRGFYALAAQQLKLARRNGQQALLLFADIDGLKQINDRFGHAEGDTAIKRVAEVLRRTFRDSDVIARLGGDEFAVLANEATGESEDEILRRLHEEAGRDTRYPLSLSVGVTRFDPQNPATLEELLSSADRAMYQVKRSRLSVVRPEAPSGKAEMNKAEVKKADGPAVA